MKKWSSVRSEKKKQGGNAVHLPLQLQVAGALFPRRSFLHQQQFMINIQIDELNVASSNKIRPEALRFSNARLFETLFCASLSKPLLFAYSRRTPELGTLGATRAGEFRAACR
jgi:hypothetical protein